MFELYELFTLTPHREVMTSTGTTYLPTVTENRCRHKIETNIHLFRSMWYAGCGYSNFSQLFSNLCRELTNILEKDMNWGEFNDMWDETMNVDGKEVALSKLHKKYGTTVHPGMCVQEFTDLLYTLCKK